MSTAPNFDGILKRSKLTVADVFINWRRRVKAYLQQQTIDSLGLTNRLDSASTVQQRHRIEANVKTKSAFTLTLADGTLAQGSTLMDDDNCTAKVLWMNFNKIFRTSITQVVINIEREVETMTIDNDEESEKHVEKFHQLIFKIPSYN